MIYSLVVVILVAIVFTLLLIFKNKIPSVYLEKGLKISVVVLFTIANIRQFLNDNFIWMINGGTYGEIYYKQTDILQTLVRWGHYLSFVVLPCAVFFKARFYKNLAIYFCFFVTIIQLFIFNQTMTYFVTDSSRALYAPEWFRYLEYMLELFICLIVPLILRFIKGHRFNIKDKKEYLYFFGLLPIALMIVMPVYVPQSLFGFTLRYMYPLSLENFSWILLIFLMTAIIYFCFRFKDYETRYSILVFLALLLFVHYNSIYLMDLIASRLPFQLCNLGAYLVLIALLIKKQGFFEFVLLANVPGAAIALFAVDVSEGLLSFWNIHFYIEHTWVFILPLLCIALRIFKRPGKHAIKHFLIGFTTYFLFCAVAGVVMNYLYMKYYQLGHTFFDKVNYFYMFDDKVLSFLPFLGFTRKLGVTIGDYTFYPIYMLMVYILFVIFCFAFYYIYRIFLNIGDDHFRLRQIRINMKQEKGYYEKHHKKVPQLTYDETGEELC